MVVTRGVTPPGNPFLAPKLPFLSFFQLCASCPHNAPQKCLMTSSVGGGHIHTYGSFGSSDATG